MKNNKEDLLELLFCILGFIIFIRSSENIVNVDLKIKFDE